MMMNLKKFCILCIESYILYLYILYFYNFKLFYIIFYFVFKILYYINLYIKMDKVLKELKLDNTLNKKQFRQKTNKSVWMELPHHNNWN
jgi:hypothetical protein